MQIYIYSQPGDFHGIATKFALESMGHHVDRQIGLDVYRGVNHSLYYSPGQDSEWVSSGKGTTAYTPRYDSIWFRRPYRVSSPIPLNRADAQFAGEEWRILGNAFGNWHKDAFWVNSIFGSYTASNKPTQLREANRLGLAFPDTLISNDPEAIRNFVAAKNDVIFKPLHGAAWRQGDISVSTFSAKVTPDVLYPDEKLLACPGIYQKKVGKAFEVRAQFWGAQCFAARINSQESTHGKLDWRLGQTTEDLKPSPIELPMNVHAACRSMMHALGIVSGAFDFIVTPEGEWVFLEVNEAGQFLFLESWCPDFPVLDAFAQFLTSRNPDFVYKAPLQPIRSREIMELPEFKEQVRREQCEFPDAANIGVIEE